MTVCVYNIAESRSEIAIRTNGLGYFGENFPHTMTVNFHTFE